MPPLALPGKEMRHEYFLLYQYAGLRSVRHHRRAGVLEPDRIRHPPPPPSIEGDVAGISAIRAMP